MKKLKFYFLLPLSMALSVSLFSQTISGTVNDPAGKPQEFATVMLMRAKDTALVKGAISDENGRFELEKIAAGRYFTRVSMVGFKNYNSKPFDYDGTNLTLENIPLSKLDNELKEVTITAQKPLIEVQADKLVLNVDASPTNMGLNALELLRKSPGVSLDQNENVSLKGRQNVIVQINGKVSPMSGQDLAQFLKGLNSSDIEAIEIISNPGAKYDAEGNAGIINIRLKKDKKLGTNGSVSIGLSQGITPKGDASFSFNHRDKKVNVFGSASMFRGIFHNSMNMDNQISTKDAHFDQQNAMRWFAKPQNARLGLDYSPNRHHTFGVLVTGGLFVPTNSSNGRTNIGSLSTERRDSILIASNEGKMQNWNANFNVNYKFSDTLGNELNIDADYGLFRDSQTIMNNNVYRNGEDNRTLSSSSFKMVMPRDIDIKSIKADYERPLSIFSKKDSKFGAGVKLSNVLTDNRFNFMNVINNQDEFDVDRSNNFTYQEKISAGYANFNTKFKKMTIQAGLRLEHTDSRGDLVAYKPVNNKTVDTSYTNVFPSLALGYQFSKNVAMNLTFRRSIDRPRYQQLNPFEQRLDEISFRKGNPFIRPQYTNSVEMGWTLWQRANLSVNYAHTDNAFAEISDTEIDPLTGKQRFLLQTRNLATRNNIGLSLTTPIPIRKWWNGNLNLFYNYSIIEADYGNGKTLDTRVGGGGFWMQNVFTLSKTWTAELGGWGSFGGMWGAYINRPQGVMDIGVTKRLWNGDGTLRLSFTDVWHTARWSAYTRLGGLYIDASGAWEGQQLKANFTYRFGNKNVQNARRRATGMEDESKRAGGDGGGGTRN
ncbi:MAG: TonB-dependent receptor [Saprospiraceae bacterium]|nr:TonB-dependent receptor [Saprospiraceae bacterium]